MHKKIKSVIFAIFFVSFLQGCLPTYFNGAKLTTIYVLPENPGITHIKNLFVSASGNMSSRVVSNKLFITLNKVMTKKGSISVFEFNSTFGGQPKAGIENIETGLYDGFMILSPSGSTSIHTKEKYVFAVPWPSGSGVNGTGEGMVYEDSFMIEIYNSTKQLIYEGEISFHFDPSQGAIYSVVVQKLIKQLTKANIQLW